MAVHRGNRWTSEEDDRLRNLIAAKTSPVLISVKLKPRIILVDERTAPLDSQRARIDTIERKRNKPAAYKAR